MQSVENGDFRQDLYYRLNVFPLFVPALRDRDKDVVLLAKSFAQRFSRKHGIKLAGFDDEATRALISHDWPGNVRELQNTIERAVILTEPGSKISAMSLGLMPSAMRTQSVANAESVASRELVGAGSHSNGFGGTDFPSFNSPIGDNGFGDEPAVESQSPEDEEPLPLEQIERQHILKTLESTEGNRTQASKILGISIRTLRNKLSIYRFDGEFIPAEES